MLLDRHSSSRRVALVWAALVWAALVWAALASLVVGCSDGTPTSVLLEISATSAVGELEALRLDIYGPRGLALGAYRLPAEGPPILPSETVLYPPSGGELRLRLRLRGYRSAATVAEGATRVTPESGKQVRAQLVLGSGRLPDRDGDDVPDALDNCPDLPNPLQGPCGGDDGGIDAGDGPPADLSDGPAGDGPQDAAPDVPPDLAPDQGPKTCINATHCSDGDLCTKDSCVANVCVWTPLTCAGPNQVCHRWAACDAKQGCVEEPVADKTTCSDGLYCTVNDQCTAGTCSGSPRDCQSGAAPCQVASCNNATARCVSTNELAGAACDDGDACTQDDRCVSIGPGVNCLAPGIAPITVEAQNMLARGDHPVVVDAAGVVHAVYSASALRYAHNTGGSWSLSNQDTGNNVGLYPSLTMDAAGKLHAVYEANGTLRHATFDRGGGPTTTDDGGPTDGHVSATIDAGGVLHVAHRRGDALYYSRRASGPLGSWTHTLVHAPTQTALNPSLTLDGSGFVHIAYGVGNVVNPTTWFSGELRHASNESGAWVHTQLAPSTGAEGNFASLAITSNGTLFVAHAAMLASLSHGDLLLATRNPTTKAWSSTVLVAGGRLGSYSSILLGASDHLHVLYRDFGKNELLHLTNATGSWSTPVLLDQGNLVGRWAAFARAPSGRLHAVYEDEGKHLVRAVSWSSCQ